MLNEPAVKRNRVCKSNSANKALSKQKTRTKAGGKSSSNDMYFADSEYSMQSTEYEENSSEWERLSGFSSSDLIDDSDWAL